MGIYDDYFNPLTLLDKLFYNDPSKEANKYLDKVPGTAKPYYDPSISAGNRQLPGLEEQFGRLMNDPSSVLKGIGEGYEKSPGFDFALQQALQGGQHAAAAGGMAGSPAAQQESMQLAHDIASQDYDKYMEKALNLYGKGLEGSKGLFETGTNMSDRLAQLLSENLGNQASLGFSGEANKNKFNMGMLGLLASMMNGGGGFGGGASAMSGGFS